MSQQFIFDKSTASVVITVLDEVKDTEERGIFKFRCHLTPMDIIDTDAFYRELIGVRPSESDRVADRMAYSLSQLRYRVIDAPEWWKKDPEGRSQIWGGHCNKNVVVEVFNVAVTAETLYLEKLKKESKHARQILEEKFDSGEIERELDIDDGRAEDQEDNSSPEPIVLGE